MTCIVASFAGLEQQSPEAISAAPRTAGARNHAAPPADRPASVVSVESYAISSLAVGYLAVGRLAHLLRGVSFAAAFRPSDHMRLETATLAATREPDHLSVTRSNLADHYGTQTA
jgi:hypothetical protein